MVTPLTQQNSRNETLQRLPAVESEIAMALTLSPPQLLERSTQAEASESGLSSECLVHLIRADLRNPDTPLLELLLPVLLARCAANLKYTVSGFREPTLGMVREEILGELALLLIEPGASADFFEVRFWLAFARLRIDFCNKYKRHDDHLVFVDDRPEAEEDYPNPILEIGDGSSTATLDPEQACIVGDALARLDAAERKVYGLHLLGIPINAGTVNIVGLTGWSERTVRNRLRSAEQSLAAYKERVR